MPDNYVQDPSNTQNFNRYSYVLNNPLRYTDPSGEMMQAEFDAVVTKLLNSSNGGSWNVDGGIDYFSSQDAGFGFGMGYMNQHNAWGGGAGWAGSPGQALDRFNGGSITTGMVEGYYGQRWAGKLYNISAGHASNGMGFTISATLGAANDANVAVAYTSYEKMAQLMGITGSSSSDDGNFYNDVLSFADKHFNGGLGIGSVAITGYNKIPNDVKRHYAYKLSKITGVKSGKIFQGTKSFFNNSKNVISKLAPYGTALGVGVIGYDLFDDGHLKTSSIINGALIGVGLAFPVTAPFILMYGVLDYTFDLGNRLDKKFGTVNTHIYD